MKNIETRNHVDMVEVVSDRETEQDIYCEECGSKIPTPSREYQCRECGEWYFPPKKKEVPKEEESVVTGDIEQLVCEKNQSIDTLILEKALSYGCKPEVVEKLLQDDEVWSRLKQLRSDGYNQMPHF